MSTQLGQAYVQIIPSSRGITGSIQKVLDPEATSAGKSAGTKLADSISSSMGSLGKTLTKSITLPAMGAAAAAGGIIAALGWGRLTGLDSARAQLEGLGYDLKSVERISSLVSDTIQGTTTTMAEGVSIAAGALAAGVKEGAELERYIRLVGDAAVGAGRDTGAMAQIFNRVQGAGKLMTMELNMIEDGMPGFAMAMSEGLGVPQDEFRKMVTEGKVSSEQFLDIMEGFAGNMSDAYAGSWKGIVSRTKSNIGILGEIMLGGVFEQSKESLAGFLEFIRTDDVRGWFSDAGAAIGQAFTNVIETVKSAISWWTGLSDTTKSVIKTLGLLAVAIGPVLMIVSKMIAVVTAASQIFAALKAAAGVLGVAIGAISAPVAIAVGAIAAMIAIGVALYKNWDTVKEKASQLGQWVANVFNGLKDAVTGAFNNVKTAVSEGMTSALNTVKGFFDKFRDAGRNIITAIADGIKSAIGKVTDAISGVTQKVRDFLPFSPAKEGPLKDLHKLNFGGTISLSIKDGEDEVKKAMDELLNLTALASNFRVSPGQGLNRGTEITQNITIESPTPLTPSEVARKVKNASRNLAMEW